MKHRNIFFLTIIINKIYNTFWVIWCPVHIQIYIVGKMYLHNIFVEIRFKTMLILQEVFFQILYNLQLAFPLFFYPIILLQKRFMVEKFNFWISLLVSLKCHFTWTVSHLWIYRQLKVISRDRSRYLLKLFFFLSFFIGILWAGASYCSVLRVSNVWLSHS